jgi:hypothetical protein
MTLAGTPCAETENAIKRPLSSAKFFLLQQRQTATLLQKLAATDSDTQFGHAIEYAAQLSFPALI